MAGENTCRPIQAKCGFGDFLLKNEFLWQNWRTSQVFTLLKGKKVSFCSQPQSTKPGGYNLHKNVCCSLIYGVIILLHMGRLAIKHPLISVNSDVIQNFLCKLHFGMIYIFMWSDETLFEKRGNEKYWYKWSKSSGQILWSNSLDPSFTVGNWWKCVGPIKLTSK